MRLYAQVSGTFFALIAAAQLTRTLFAWPARVADFAIPVWWSAGASLVTAALSMWAFRTAKSAA